MISYNRIAIIADYPRIKRAYDVRFKLYRATHDTWPALFKTKEHQRRVRRLEKAVQRWTRTVEAELDINPPWDVKRLHKVGPVIVWRDPWIT